MTCLVLCTPLVICDLRRFELSQISGILEWDYGHAPMMWDSRTHQLTPTLTWEVAHNMHPSIHQKYANSYPQSFHQISMPNSHPEVCAFPYTILLLTSPSWHLSISLFEIPLKQVGISYPWKKRKSQKTWTGKSKSPSENIYIIHFFRAHMFTFSHSHPKIKRVMIQGVTKNI